MQQLPWKRIYRIATVGSTSLMLAALLWGGLVLADSTQNESERRHQTSTQIGVLACPSGASINFTPTYPDADETVYFSADITPPVGGGVITATWNFGDGSAEQIGQNIQHTYSMNGVYTVIMTATGDSCGSPPVATRNITVGTGIAPVSIIYLPLLFKSYPLIVFPTGSSIPVTTVTVPPQVTGLAGFVDQGKTYLRWNPAPPTEAVHRYKIYRYKQGLDEKFKLWGVVPAGITTFTDPTAACGTAYYVTAVNSAGESAASTASYYSPACDY